MKRFFTTLVSIAALFTAAASAADAPDAEELEKFFTIRTFLAGRNTPARYYTDRILNVETEILLKQLRSPDAETRRNAFWSLGMRKRAIEYAIKLEKRSFKTNIPAIENITTDGRLDDWHTIAPAWSGSYSSFPQAAPEKADDSSIWYVAADKTHIHFAAFFKDSNIVFNREKPWAGDSIELFFLTPGNGWQYMEIIVSPGCGITLSKQQHYTGTGTRVESASGFASSAGIKGASRISDGAFTAEISVPRRLFSISDGSIHFMLVKTSQNRTQRTPVASSSEGHDIFSFINGILPVFTEKKEKGASK